MSIPPARPEDTPLGADHGSAWQPPPVGQPAPAASDTPSPGTPPHGVPTQGTPSQGTPPQGVPTQGTPSQGTAAQWPQGAFTPPPPGYAPHGYVPAGQQPGWRPPPPALAPNGQPLASFSDRFLAYLIDTLIYSAVSLIWVGPFLIYWLSTFYTKMNEFSRQYDPGDPFAPAPPIGDLMLALYLPMLAFIGVTFVLGVLYTYVYFVEYQFRKSGQTVGKRTMKIQVIPTAPGTTLGRGHMVKRWAIQFVATPFVPMGGLIDGLWQLWDKPLQQCLHDKVAATVVVKVG